MAFERLKKKWGVDTNRRFIVIMIVFSLAGMSILWVKTPVYGALGVTEHTTLWLKVPICLAIYQVLLIAWGTLMGEFRFFWEKEKKLGRGILRLCNPATYTKSGPGT